MKKHNVAATILFCGFLFIFAALYLLLPKSDFSEMEKRYLAETPELSLENVFSGEWSKQAEEYLTDHVPGRNLLVGVHAYVELLAGRQHLKDVWLEEGKLLEAPVELDEKAIARNMHAINTFAEKLDKTVHVMVVPSAGWAAGVDGYTDSDSLEAIYAAAGSKVSPVSVEGLYEGKPELYYNTDHHWTSQGAYNGYAAYMQAVGREYRSQEDFVVTVAEDFQGSTYSRSALWLTEAEPLEMWHGSQNLQVTNGEVEGVHAGVFYEERLDEIDKYTVYLDGNHSMVRIENPENAGKGKLLVIRDSYANCLGCFLAESYETVVLVDLRYYKNPISELYAQEGFDDVLVSYSLSNFMTDTNLVWLR